MLQYASRWWQAEGASGGVYTDLPISATYETTEAQAGTEGILACYTGGAAGLQLGTLDLPARVAAATNQIAQIAGGSASTVVRYGGVMWQNEPYSGGTYTAYRPGQVLRYWDVLRQPVGRIWLAGEHTDVFTAYMEGACRSGVRVANAIAVAAG
jgi:monoamine oxidase